MAKLNYNDICNAIENVQTLCLDKDVAVYISLRDFGKILGLSEEAIEEFIKEDLEEDSP